MKRTPIRRAAANVTAFTIAGSPAARGMFSKGDGAPVAEARARCR
jgi:hypothetical protein